MLAAFLDGGAAIAVLARSVGAALTVVDAGVLAPPSDPRIAATGLAPSANLAQEAALSDAAVDVAIAAGRRLARDAAAGGATVIVGGDMGIGNTTPATCLAAWLSGRDGSQLCGRGTGLDDEGLERKRAVVDRALALHRPRADHPREALRRLGGGEIAVLAGLVLGAGESGLGYVCDGVIATAAAAVAAGLEPAVRPRLLAGHRSPEPAHTALLDHLELEPVLDLGLRLGEASGAAAAVAVLRLACDLHAGMSTFDEAAVGGRA